MLTGTWEDPEGCPGGLWSGRAPVLHQAGMGRPYPPPFYVPDRGTKLILCVSARRERVVVYGTPPMTAMAVQSYVGIEIAAGVFSAEPSFSSPFGFVSDQNARGDRFRSSPPKIEREKLCAAISRPSKAQSRSAKAKICPTEGIV